jgi:transposase InsO family protein
MFGPQGIRRVVGRAAAAIRDALAPAGGGAVRGVLADLTRSRQELLAENAFLRHQLVVAARRVKRAHLRAGDRALLVALAAAFSYWREALILVKPETLLRWHRQGFKLFWTWRSKRKSNPGRRLAKDVIVLIRTMATANRLWGAERIRGELLKLGYSAAKSTIQRYLAQFRGLAPGGQRWSTFLRNQAHAIWCCDLLEVRDVFFRCHYVIVVMHLETRRMLGAVSTREPTADWLAQQLRLLTPFGRGPTFLIRDNDRKFGEAFDAVARGAGTQVICTPLMSPKANAHVERMIGSVRRECLDHVLVHNEQHLQRVLDEYRQYFNEARPHQGIGQRRPDAFAQEPRAATAVPARMIVARPMLDGLHHDYRAAA